MTELNEGWDDYLQPLIPLHRFITVCALLTGAAQLIFLYNLMHSRFRGKPATDNPWEGTLLEWSTPITPPPHNNFGSELPVVYHDPYQCGVEGCRGDYVIAQEQSVPAGGLFRLVRQRGW